MPQKTFPFPAFNYAFSQVTGYSYTEEEKHKKQDHSRSQQRSEPEHLFGLLKGRHYKSWKAGMYLYQEYSLKHSHAPLLYVKLMLPEKPTSKWKEERADWELETLSCTGTWDKYTEVHIRYLCMLWKYQIKCFKGDKWQNTLFSGLVIV